MARDTVLIAGPTASGKSAHALAMATASGAAIINTDSMQVYDKLRILTARPDDAEMTKAPHHLYGHVDPSDAYSTGRWIRDVASVLKQLPPDQPVTFVGGTGLYFQALTGGLSPMPKIDPAIRANLRERLDTEGLGLLRQELEHVDPKSAGGIDPTDSQRTLRALEVYHASGKPLSWWQSQPGEALIDANSAKKHVLLPQRGVLHARINRRFADMTSSGAVEEVQALLARNLDPELPAMKAIGVPEIAAALAGTLDWNEAITRAQAATRQYAKRQMTWLRQRMDDSWERLES